MLDISGESRNIIGLVQLDLISRILRLQDYATNGFNSGQLDGKPIVIDFLIETQKTGYKYLNIPNEFLNNNGDSDNDTGLMKSASRLPRDTKLAILKESLKAWNLLENIDKVEVEVNQFIEKQV